MESMLCYLVIFAGLVSGNQNDFIELKKQLYSLPFFNEISPRYTWYTIEQNVDHFNLNNKQTWKQRYMQEEAFYKKGGPMFVYVGGEHEAHQVVFKYGPMREAAKKHNGVMYAPEHRFYGRSQPTKSNLSTENLQYLSNEQAIVDLIYFIQNRKEKVQSGPVILFGGDYSGNLAVWSKIKYPHIVHGVVASSAPVLAKSDFTEYYEVVNNVINSIDSECTNIIKNATDEIELLFKSDEGAKKVNELFDTCSFIESNDKQNVSSFFDYIAMKFSLLVQYSSGTQVADACQRLKSFNGSATEKLAQYIKEVYCLPINYREFVDHLQKETVDTDYLRQIYYQKCTEFGYFETTGSKNQPFGTSITTDYRNQLCTDVFGSDFTGKFNKKRIDRTNLMNGGNTPNVTNVVFVNGNMDPWYPLGVIQDLNANTKTIFINGSSHCADLLPIGLFDNENLIAAKKEVQSIISSWV